MLKDHKKVLLGFVAALLVLALGSVASACTVWVGQFTVKTDNDGDGVKGNDNYEKVTTLGLGTGMNHCWMEGAIRLDVDSATVDGDGKSPNTIRIEYGPLTSSRPAACSLASTRNPNPGSYKISYLNTGFGDYVGGNLFGWTGTNGNEEYLVDSTLQRVYVRDCMANGGHQSTWIDNETLSVAGGSGAADITIDAKPSGTNGGRGIADLPGTESAICIQDDVYTGAPDGAQAPIIVI